MFLYQLLISCWIKGVKRKDINIILQYAVDNYNLKLRKDFKITNRTVDTFSQHIKNYIPEIKMARDSIYNNDNIIRIILLLERATSTNNPIFLKLYPTDSILDKILIVKNIGKDDDEILPM